MINAISADRRFVMIRYMKQITIEKPRIANMAGLSLFIRRTEPPAATSGRSEDGLWGEADQAMAEVPHWMVRGESWENLACCYVCSMQFSVIT